LFLIMVTLKIRSPQTLLYERAKKIDKIFRQKSCGNQNLPYLTHFHIIHINLLNDSRARVFKLYLTTRFKATQSGVEQLGGGRKKWKLHLHNFYMIVYAKMRHFNLRYRQSKPADNQGQVRRFESKTSRNWKIQNMKNRNPSSLSKSSLTG
jgi:hypothetical protein